MHHICLYFALPAQKTMLSGSQSGYACFKMFSLPSSSSLDLRQMGRGGVTEILLRVKWRMKQTTSTMACH